MQHPDKAYSSIAKICQNFSDEVIVDGDQAQTFNRSLWEELGKEKLQGVSIDEEYGGKGYSIKESILALEEFGYHCQDNGLSFAVGAHFLAGVIPIYLYGTENQKQNLLPDLCNGKTIIANAISEAQSGSDVFNMKTTAFKKEHNYLLLGQKTYCSNAPVADYVIAYAMTNPQKGMFGGISAFIVDRKKNQFKTSKAVDKMGLRTCLMSDVIFDNIEVSSAQLLGKEGGGAVIFNQAMIWERIGLSALHLGTLKRIFEDIKLFVNKRKAFGKTLSQFQAISHKLVDIKIELDACRLLLLEAIIQLESEAKSVDLTASILKLKTSELYKKAAVEILQIAGANGYINNSYFERTVRDAMASTLYSGSSEVHRNLIARKIGLK